MSTDSPNTGNQYSNLAEQHSDAKAVSPDSRKNYARVVRAILIVVPAVAGFLIAYAILTALRPFATTWEFVAWFLVALVISLITSVFVGDYTLDFLSRTKLYQRANSFDTTVEELFGSSLREGNPKAIKRQALERGLDPQFIDDVINLLTQLGDHEKLTRGHSERVRAYTSLIGKEMGLRDEELEKLNWTALLHDIGKLDVPPWVLSSPNKPTEAEWETLKRHPESARHRLRRLEQTLGPSIYEGALEHHERWDGTGYPNGYKEGQISLFGRITAVADAFDVITHARSYKQANTIAEARHELMSGAGSQFDPDVVAAFIRVGDEDLKKVRGWSATVAGVAVTGSQLVSAGGRLAAVAATVTGVGVATQATVTTVPPPAVAFEATTTTAAPTTTTTAAPTTTTTAAPTTTIATTTTTTTTTTIAPRMVTVIYQIGTNEIDGVVVELSAVDTLEVFFNEELHQVVEIEPGQVDVPLVFDVTELAPGVYPVRFDLFSDGVLISSDNTALPVS